MLPGVFEDEISAHSARVSSQPTSSASRDCYRSPGEIEGITSRELTDDPIFGKLSELQIEDFLDSTRAAALREQLNRNRDQVSFRLANQRQGRYTN